MTILRHWGILWSQGKKAQRKYRANEKDLPESIIKLTNNYNIVRLRQFVKENKQGGEKMDKLELEIAMKRKGINAVSLAKIIGISLSTLYKKMNGNSEFTRSEIQRIVEALGLESPMGIFFT